MLWVEILNAPSVTIAFLRSLTETHEKEVMSGWLSYVAGHGNADRLVVYVQLFLLDLLCAKQACPVEIIGEISMVDLQVAQWFMCP